ncbi:MAG TPA: DsbA family protein [Sphingomonas sp.]|jgi:protein-disulfide isomerase
MTARWLLPAVALGGAALGAGGVYAVGKASGGAMVREYLLANPEVIPEAMERLQRREQARAVAKAGGGVAKPYPGAFMGNPDGDVTLVEYYDYNCGICRASLPVVRELIRRDPKLKVVFREMPVLAPSSRDAALASLAAARAGRFAAFHNALFGRGPVTSDSIAAAARTAGVALPGPDRTADAEIERNLRTANELGITGVPSWVVGDQVFVGGHGVERLRQAIAEVRRGA